MTIIKRSLPIVVILIVILYFLLAAQYQTAMSKVDERLRPAQEAISKTDEFIRNMKNQR